ncbi:uncharacterized protein LOC132296543 [Cornus florida]|uniref:uncharacterized protein LOC132296543 n=1 Tax=Cornus florida TaxID=4283 RepID=UPI00289CC8C3|nr:uncharacterized protein LOC132296543 [Cornus florida]
MGASIGVKLQTPEGTSLSQALWLKFRATNNEAEYEALLAGLRLAKELKEQNDKMLRFNLDILEEKRDAAAIRLASYQQTLANSHNKRVKHRDFALGDLVLKKKVGMVKKMMSPWKRPYRIAEVIGKGAYMLETMAGRLVNKPWNATSLKRYYM